jgi:ABC-type uncharacterized transport system ATPase component
MTYSTECEFTFHMQSRGIASGGKRVEVRKRIKLLDTRERSLLVLSGGQREVIVVLMAGVSC